MAIRRSVWRYVIGSSKEPPSVVLSTPASRPLAGLALAFLLLVGLLAPPAAPPAAHALTLPTYRIEATLDVDGARLTARQVVRLRNTVGTPLDRAVFRAVPGARGMLTVEAASVDGQAATPRLDRSILEVPFDSALAPGATAEIELRYALRVPREAGRLSATPRGISLGNWVPLLTVHRGDWDRRQYVEVGDAFYSEVADFDVTLTTSRPVEVAATGRAVEQDGTRARYVASTVRDFAIAASAGYIVHTVSAEGTRVTAYALSADKARVYAERGAELVRWFGARLGAYPYPALAIVETDLPAAYGGMEYPGLIMVSAQYALPGRFSGSEVEVLLAHEIVHQWFYSWVGSDQIADPWLDEAFATYLPALYYAEVRPELYESMLSRWAGSGGAGPVDRSVYDFAADGPYFSVVYRGGARFLHRLRQALGPAAFDDFVRRYVATYRDRLATPVAFLDLAQSSTTANLNPIISEHFTYPAFHYRTPQDWTLEAPSGPWQGSANLFVGAEFPVARVQLWLDGRLLADGPENALTVDLAGVEPGEYVLLARVWNHEGTTFERARRVEVRG
jgi:aminopeptidase N